MNFTFYMTQIRNYSSISRTKYYVPQFLHHPIILQMIKIVHHLWSMIDLGIIFKKYLMLQSPYIFKRKSSVFLVLFILCIPHKQRKDETKIIQTNGQDIICESVPLILSEKSLEKRCEKKSQNEKNHSMTLVTCLQSRSYTPTKILSALLIKLCEKKLTIIKSMYFST